MKAVVIQPAALYEWEGRMLSTIVDERNIPQPALLWRPDLAENKQQQIVEAIETAAY
jgi:hypothetical protein